MYVYIYIVYVCIYTYICRYFFKDVWRHIFPEAFRASLALYSALRCEAGAGFFCGQRPGRGLGSEPDFEKSALTVEGFRQGSIRELSGLV